MVNIDNIHVLDDRIMHPTQKRIDAMARSLSGPMGQISSVLIAKHLYSSWKVVAGATRVLAADQLGWKQIEATIIGADNDFEYGLIEVAENLHRHDLSENERAKLKKVEGELFAKRRAFFEKLLAENPDLMTGKPAKGGRGNKGGVRDAARKAGVPRRTARRAVDKAGQTETRPTLPTPEPAELSVAPVEQPVTSDHIGHFTDAEIKITRAEWEALMSPDRGPDAPGLMPCPMCHGTGTVEIEKEMQ
ncbi:MAG TPA: ParB N-terminal domain-containing protein [Candidatus Saccharimonadales bacterium]|nr:ParB N-terminal domain-containing protein [Candidatus Saccharimonadales bacterium]